MAPVSLEVARARRGDAAAWRALYDAHAPAVYGYCLAFTRGDASAADDLLQESFAAAFAGLGGLAEDEAFGAWVRTIARRRCLRWIEGRRREAAAVETLKHEAPAVPEPDLTPLAHAVLGACPDPALQQTARLFYGDPPRTTSEIAAQLGLTVTAVTTRLHRFRTWARTWALRRIDLGPESIHAEGSP